MTRVHLAAGTGAEERERDVEVLARDGADTRNAGELAPLPLDQPVESFVWEPESAEEPDAFIGLHATGGGAQCLCRLCNKRRRKVWRAVTAARARIVVRSAGTLNSAPLEPYGPAAWKYTSPTGFSGELPPGPATPVTDTATSAPSALRTPSAIAAAVSAETAPWPSSVSAGTPSSSRLTSFE